MRGGRGSAEQAEGLPMDPGTTLGEMVRRKLVAAIRTKTPEQALASAEAVAAGGIASLEIALTIPGAVEVIRALAHRTRLAVGAGGVLTKEQAETALAARASFLVCPVGDVSLVPLCREAGVVSVLGAATPSEIWQAHRAGTDVVRVFPVNALGGPRYLRTIRESLPPVPVMVEGDVTLENVPDYLALPVQMIVLGECVVVPGLVARGVYASITARARDFALLVGKRTGIR
jgi:2-dehydro-3-deoxyphosphogluconate aldolase / (4S)-4-hydroxy-2-oxoglutarate aldolase